MIIVPNSGKRTKIPGKAEREIILMKDPSSIYVHIPFCRRQCYYCNFSKFNYEEYYVKKYIDNICIEIGLRSNSDFPIDTIYFGGGSPAILDDSLLTQIVDKISNNFDTRNVSEMTIEVNPEDCSAEKFSLFQHLGFNRISIGVQSFSDADLIYLERNHNSKESIRAVESAVESGFSNINVDFILGLPGQDRFSLEENIRILSGFDISHLSSYLLEGVKRIPGKESPDPDHQGDLYNTFREKIAEEGFEHYEVSNFCRDGSYSRHNMNYWEGGSYIGIGSSASGYEHGTDYSNFSDLNQYFRSLRKGILPRSEEIKNDPVERKLFTGLRMLKGVEKQSVANYEKKIHELIEEGIIEKKGKYFRVLPSSLVLLNEVLAYLI